MKKELTAAAAALALSVAFSGEVESAAAAPVQTITVYASRIDDAKDDMACSVSVYGAGEIEDSGAHNLAELLKKKACVDVHAMNGNPLLTSIAMRGFGDNAFGRVKVVLDGEELNNVDMAAPNMTRIPLWFASRVEVLRGPSPVLYGDGAIGGVVNVRTDGTSYGRKTRMTARGGSHGTFGAAMLTSGGIEEDGILYSGGYDYLRSDGFRSRSGYDIHTANAGVRKNFANGGTFGVKVNYQNAYYELPGSLTFDEWKHHRRKAVNRGDWTRLWSWGIAADSKLKLAEDRWLRLDASISRQYRHAKMQVWRTDTEYGYWSGAISPRYIDENDFLGHANKFTAGFDFRLDGYGEDALGSRTRRFSRLRTAAFAQEEFFITEEFSLVAGARAERIENRWRHYAGLRESHSSDLMADFELGVVYRPLDGLKLYAKATRFHRSAFCDELSNTQNGKFLNPETGESLDAGFEWEFLEEFKADFSAYGMLMDDEIFFDPAMAPFGYNRNRRVSTPASPGTATKPQRRRCATATSTPTSRADATTGAMCRMCRRTVCGRRPASGLCEIWNSKAAVLSSIPNTCPEITPTPRTGFLRIRCSTQDFTTNRPGRRDGKRRSRWTTFSTAIIAIMPVSATTIPRTAGVSSSR